MAATFDATRLDGTQYTMGRAVDVIRFQNTVEDFFEVVRANPTYIAANPEMIRQFTRLIDHDLTFPCAAMITPELRLPRTYDTSAVTVINAIIRAPGIKRRRPPPALEDPTNAPERRLIRRQMRNLVNYMEFDRGRGDAATPEHREEMQDLVERASNIVCE